MGADPVRSCEARAVTRLWTIGYERLLPEALVAELRAEHGIAYENRRALGTPPDLRVLFRAGRIAEAREAFADHVETRAAGELDALADELATAPPTALLCLEADPAGCHRRVIAEALVRRRRDLRVIDL